MIQSLLESGFIWSFIWQATFCLGLGIVVSLIWSRQPGRAHRVLLLALIASLTIPFLRQTVCYLEWGLIPHSSNYQIEKDSANARSFHIPVEEDLFGEGSRESTDVRLSTGSSFILQWINALSPKTASMILWLILTVLASVRLFLYLLTEIRVLRNAEPCDQADLYRTVCKAAAKLDLKITPRIYQSNHVRCPVMWCWGRYPTLMLPDSLDSTSIYRDWTGILCHELAHWKRRDHLSQLVGEIVVCIFPWHPLAWWAKKRLGRLSEQACDDWALAHVSSPTTYANALLNLIPQSRHAFSLPAVSRRSKLKERILHILDESKKMPELGRRWSYLATFITLLLTVMVSFGQTKGGTSDFPLQPMPLPLRGPSGEILDDLGELRDIDYSPNGKYVLTAGNPGAYLWDVETGALVRTIMKSGCDKVWGAAFSPNDARLLAVIWPPEAALWDVSTGEEITAFPVNFNYSRAVALSPDSKYMLVSGYDGKQTAGLYDIATGRNIRNLGDFPGTVRGVNFSPDGKYVAIGTADLRARIWDPFSGQQIREFFHKANVQSVAFSPDGKYLVSGSGDSTAKVWNIETGEELLSLPHETVVNSVAFSPDGKYVIATGNKTAELWDIETGQNVRSFVGHKDYVFVVVFSPDGARILTGSVDNTAKLWDVESGKEIRTFHRLPGEAEG
ncbi:MAG: M56 family metallopeptidase [bacterium]